MLDPKLNAFARAYGQQREAEGRRLSSTEMLALPWLRHGPQADQWAVRARTFEAFMDRVLRPAARSKEVPLTVLDLGAGNGWLSYQVACKGHRAIAIDIRADKVDGLGAADCLAAHSPSRIERVIASFAAIPLADATADLTVFNASLHYATDLTAVLSEAHRLTAPGGTIAILDSPFYRSEAAGTAMVLDKRRRAPELFGDRAAVLTSLDCIEFLTRDRLRTASEALGIEWHCHRVLYPAAYELRPLIAAIRRCRTPSRFDMWTAKVR